MASMSSEEYVIFGRARFVCTRVLFAVSQLSSRRSASFFAAWRDSWVGPGTECVDDVARLVSWTARRDAGADTVLADDTNDLEGGGTGTAAAVLGACLERFAECVCCGVVVMSAHSIVFCAHTAQKKDR